MRFGLFVVVFGLGVGGEMLLEQEPKTKRKTNKTFTLQNYVLVRGRAAGAAGLSMCVCVWMLSVSVRHASSFGPCGVGRPLNMECVRVGVQTFV